MNYACKACGSSRPVKFEMPSKDSLPEVNIKRFCGFCGKHINSVYFTEIPDYAISKRLIWALTQNVELLQKLKLQEGFRENANGVLRNIQYHNLYLALVNKAAS